MQESDPLIGRTVSGRYRVQSLLGQGGMGRVYQAQQIPLGRSVALKVISASFYSENDPEFHKRFFHEAAIMARLTNPHTVTVYDYGCDRDVYFMAMELVSGQPLDRVLQQGPMQPERAIAIAQQVCRSLREAHAKGVVHRDLKPGNVILTRGDDGEEMVKLLDFGLAKRLATIEDTNRDVLPGSPKYIAPEAIRQEPVDGRADIYALGVMMYQMLTGVVPFDRENPVDILNAHLHEAPPAMSAVNPKVKLLPAFEALVMRCLAKDPARRFRDMHEVLDALREAAMELGVGGSSALVARSMFPPSDKSAASAGSAGGASLRLAPGDVTPSAKHPVTEWNWARIGPLVALTVVALVLGVYLASESSESSVADGSQIRTSPLPTAGGSASPAKADADMVFTVNELDKGGQGQDLQQAGQQKQTTDGLPGQGGEGEPIVRVEVASNPAGATVTVDGQLMGQTPTAFVRRGEQARQGKPLALELSKAGYAPQAITKSIDGELLRVDVTLVPSGGVEAARARPGGPKKARVQGGQKKKPSGADPDEALRQLEERARALQRVEAPPSEWDPVQKTDEGTSETGPEERKPSPSFGQRAALPSREDPPPGQPDPPAPVPDESPPPSRAEPPPGQPEPPASPPDESPPPPGPPPAPTSGPPQ